MKIPIKYPCNNCGESYWFWVNINDTFFEYPCECNHLRKGSLPGSMSCKIWLRSMYELYESKDYSLSIIFSALAVECETRQLRKKFNLREQVARGDITTFDDLDRAVESLDSIFSRHENVLCKLQKAGSVWHSSGFDDFVENHDSLLTLVKEEFSEIDLSNISEELCKKIFYPRNDVVHGAKFDFDEERAEEVYRYAMLALYVMSELEKCKAVAGG